MTTNTKPTKVTRPGLRHTDADMRTEVFFRYIDECGGWPLDYPYVGFARSSEREVAFTMEPVQTAQWITIYHRDDYLMWKLSPDAWERIFKSMCDDLALRMRNQTARRYGPSVKGWCGETTPMHPIFEQRALADVIKSAKGF